MAKGKKKGGKSKSKKSQVSEGQEPPPTTDASPAPPPSKEQPKEEPHKSKQEEKAAGTTGKSGKDGKAAEGAKTGNQGPLQDPNAKQSAPISNEEKARKIEKNRAAIEAIITMLRAIPPDNISNETREDLIKIHALAKGISQRYAPVEKKSDEPKKNEEAAGAGTPAAGTAAAEFKLEDVKPAFADVFTVCEPPI